MSDIFGAGAIGAAEAAALAELEAAGRACFHASSIIAHIRGELAAFDEVDKAVAKARAQDIIASIKTGASPTFLASGLPEMEIERADAKARLAAALLASAELDAEYASAWGKAEAAGNALSDGQA